jgi:hypothetical protein
MKALNGRYALRFNRRHSRDAHLFKNRFGAVAQETDEQLRWTLRYVARNPIAEGLCSQAAEWPWSSYRATAGLSTPPSFLAVNSVLLYLGDGNEADVARYRELVDTPASLTGV